MGGEVHKPGLLVALIRTRALLDLASALAEAPFRDVDYLDGIDSVRTFKDKRGCGRGGARGGGGTFFLTSLISFVFVLSILHVRNWWENKVLQ